MLLLLSVLRLYEYKCNWYEADSSRRGPALREETEEAAVQGHLMAGRLVIVVQNGATELVPRVVADKIAERDPKMVVRVNKTVAAVEEDDPYAAFQIPDDLMW